MIRIVTLLISYGFGSGALLQTDSLHLSCKEFWYKSAILILDRKMDLKQETFRPHWRGLGFLCWWEILPVYSSDALALIWYNIPPKTHRVFPFGIFLDSKFCQVASWCQWAWLESGIWDRYKLGSLMWGCSHVRTKPRSQCENPITAVTRLTLVELQGYFSFLGEGDISQGLAAILGCAQSGKALWNSDVAGGKNRSNLLLMDGPATGTTVRICSGFSLFCLQYGCGLRHSRCTKENTELGGRSRIGFGYQNEKRGYARLVWNVRISELLTPDFTEDPS